MTRRILTLACAILSWWVVANFQPVLGPFSDYNGCMRAASQYGLATHTIAYCEQY